MTDKKYNQRVRTIKYGGIKYVNNVSTEEINEFVRQLPEEKRDSMAEVTMLLEQEGLITLIAEEKTSPPCP